MPFSTYAVFCVTSSTSAKYFPLTTFFIWGNKKVTWGEIRWIRRVGLGGPCCCWLKTAEHSVWCGWVMWSPASSVHGVVAETRQIHMDYTESCGGKGWHSHSLKRKAPWSTSTTLSRGESLDPCLEMLYWLNLHRNTGHIWKAHQSLSGSNNQIDNIQRTPRAYLESGWDS